MNNMNIVFCTDNLFEQVGTTMMSLFDFHNDISFDIYLLTSMDDVEDIHRLERVAVKHNSRLHHIKIDKDRLYFLKHINIADDVHEGLGKLLPDSAYYRWLISEYVNADRCLYLDTDVIANSKFDDYYNLPMDNIAMIGETNHYRRELVSGVLLMNLKYFRENDVFNRLCELTMQHHRDGLQINDQHILNKLLYENSKNMALKMKVTLTDRLMRHMDNVDGWKFLHFTNESKPWKLDVVYGDRWWKYNKAYINETK